MIHLRTIGPVSVQIGDRLIPATNEQVYAAILYLVAERGKLIPRRAFAELFFPSTDPDAAAHAGRQLVYRLRKMGVGLQGDAATIAMSRESALWDVDMLRSRGVALETELEFLSHGYLRNFLCHRSEGFLKWLDEHRNSVGNDLRGLLVKQIRTLRASASFGGLGAVSKACLALDPLNEEATLAAAECLAASGAKAEALELIDKYVEDIGSRSRALRVAPALLRERISDYIMEPDRRATPIVGRDKEIAAIASIIADAGHADTSACFISGVAGIGKTRLLEEACSAAALSRHAVVRTRLSSYDAHRAFAILRDLGRGLLNVPGALGASPDALDALRGLCGRGPSRFPNRPTSEAETQAVEAGVHRAVLEVVDAIADEQPLVICVEDADDIDDASLQLLLTLIGGQRRACCLIASRRRLIDRATAQTRARLIEIRLHRLSTEASHGLLSGLFKADARPAHDAFVENAVRISAGIPLLLHLLFRAFLDGGDPEALPKTLFDTVAARLDQLDEPAKCVFDAIAILGAESNDARLEALTGLPRFSLVQALRHLEESGFLRNIDNLILPSHELLGSAAVRRMPPSVARVLHRAAARVLEAEDADQIDLLAVAAHWEGCGESDRAVAALKTAADGYCKLGRPKEALAILSRAQELAATQLSRRAVDGLMLIAFQLAGEDRRALEIAETLGILSGSGSPDEQVAAIQSVMGSGLELEKYSSQLEGLASRRELESDVRTWSVWALIAASEDLGLPLLAERALAAIADVDPSDVGAIRARLIYEAVHGSPVLAVQFAHQLRDATRSASPFLRYSHLVAAAGASIRCGEIAAALQLFESAYDLANAQGISSRCVLAASHLADLAWEAGDDARARRWYADATTHIKNSNNIDRAIQYRAVGIQLALDDGCFDKAREILAESEQSFPRINRGRLAVDSLAYGIRIALSASQTPDPNKVEELLRAHLAWRGRQLHDLAADTLIWALQAAGRENEAAKLRDEYLKLYRNSRLPIAVPHLRLHANNSAAWCAG